MCDGLCLQDDWSSEFQVEFERTGSVNPVLEFGTETERFENLLKIPVNI